MPKAPPEPDFLYRRLLGPRWEDLPEPLKGLHALDSRLSAQGRARVERGDPLLARLVAGVIGFPPAAEDVAVRVTFLRRGDAEVWKRRFGRRTIQSVQEVGRDGLLVERFGPLAFGMAVSWDGTRLELHLRWQRLFGLPFPLCFAPRILAFEHLSAGCFAFHVEISHPWTGLIVRYQGWLEPV
ncbi:MAG: DUF4166 domain-containing protein [Caulobacterales bacterium]|nr:DUF4166 domain-containing protein [Caulobacterales bacterium]